MCGTSGVVCPVCHPSCTLCDPGTPDICLGCQAGTNAAFNSDSTACVVTATRKGWTNRSYDSVDNCDSSCGSCFLALDPTNCLTCADPSMEILYTSGMGKCQCKSGYQYGTGPTCTPCPGNCPYCSGPDPSDCMTREESTFIDAIWVFYHLDTPALPYITEQNGKFCYRMHRPTNTCDAGNAIETLVGPISGYSSNAATFTDAQCTKLLTAHWPYVTHWFDQLFQDFKGPSPATKYDVLWIKTILQLWILQFGPNEMKKWNQIITAMTTPGTWAAYRGDKDQGFSVNGGTDFTAFPPALAAWISSYCSDNHCADLRVFNVKRDSCLDLGCDPSLEQYCIDYGLDTTGCNYS